MVRETHITPARNTVNIKKGGSRPVISISCEHEETTQSISHLKMTSIIQMTYATTPSPCL